LSNPIEQSSEISSSSILLQSENSPCQTDSIQSIDDEFILLETQSLLNQLIEIIEQQENSLKTKIDKEQNQLINVLSKEEDNDDDEKEENESVLLNIENKTVKRKRRQTAKCPFMSKRRKHKQSKDQLQFWVDKYSIQPVTIFLDRVVVPID
jgi:hypothetical protein